MVFVAGTALSQPTTTSRTFADGKTWSTSNLNVTSVRSFCYAEDESNCQRYGRLYTWALAGEACATLGPGWRLPTDVEWTRLAQQYGGARGDDGRFGTAAYDALLKGGESGFDAVLGGGRSGEGEYARGGAHGFYWTATERSAGTAVFFNFGKGSRGLYRQNEGEKDRAFAVRCVKD
jgi:uncharacterized protein (TIGR02145 family)